MWSWAKLPEVAGLDIISENECKAQKEETKTSAEEAEMLSASRKALDSKVESDTLNLELTTKWSQLLERKLVPLCLLWSSLFLSCLLK